MLAVGRLAYSILPSPFGSGTINSCEELQQLMMNLAWALDLKASPEELEQLLASIGELSDEHSLTEAEFRGWFEGKVLTRFQIRSSCLTGHST